MPNLGFVPSTHSKLSTHVHRKTPFSLMPFPPWQGINFKQRKKGYIYNSKSSHMKALFAHFDTFIKLSDKAVKELESITVSQSLKKNEMLQEVGQTCRTIYFIRKGLARIFYYNNGNDITEHFAFESEMVVRAESLFRGNPSTKGIQMLEDSEVLAINAPKLFKLYDQYPDIERLFRLIFENEHIKTLQRLESLQFHNATERYAELSKSAETIQRIPLKHIASYLGITQVSLSRIRAMVK